MMRALPRRSTSGFTLVEILVVVMIMSMLMVTISQVLQSARQTRDTIHNIQETQLSGPAILNLIERDLRSIVTYARERADQLYVKNRVVGGMDADRIDFLTSVNGTVLVEAERGNRYVKADANEVGYVLRLSQEHDDFLEIYRREDFGCDDKPFEGGRYTFLHDRVRAFEIKVYEEDGVDAEPLEDWGHDEYVGLPHRVEISLTLELAPRLVREQLKIAPVDKRTITYTRIVRFPESLFLAASIDPIPKVPVVLPPSASANPEGGPAMVDQNGNPIPPPGGGGIPPGGDGGNLPPGGGNPFGGQPGGGAPGLFPGGG